MATTKITSPELFDLGSLDTALKLPSGTTAERPTSPSTGEWRYNTTTNLVEFYDGGSWRDLQSEDIPPIPSEHFNVVTWTGNGTSQSITGVGFQPDWVWCKERSNTSSNELIDSSRGATKFISSNNTNAEATNGQALNQFDSDGFTVGNDGAWNQSGETYVAWCWKANGGNTSSNTDGTITSTVQANTKAGFSIVTYTGDGANGTVGHGLGVAPEIVLTKRLNSTSNWSFNGSVAGFVYGTNVINLNSDAARRSDTNEVLAATSTTFTAGTSGSVGASGGDYVAYCFTSVAGYSKIGSYTGNGSANGPIINTGFEPAFVMIKRLDAIDDWIVVDNKRNTTNSRYNYLMPNANNAENGSASGTINPLVNFLTNGFQIVATWGAVNNNGSTYIYLTFASDPSTAPVLADSFGLTLYTGDGASGNSITGLGFQPDFLWIKSRSGTIADWSHTLMDAVRNSSSSVSSNTTGAEVTNTNGLESFDADGFTVGSAGGGWNYSGSNYVAWNWKANSIPTINTDGTIQSVVSANQAAGFSIVKYTGTSAAATVGHGLSSAPEFIIIKNLDSATNWAVGSDEIAWNYSLNLNDTSAKALSTNRFNSTAPTASVFSVGNTSVSNGSGNQIIAYCFHSVSGFSKFGSYSGSASAVTVTTGFQPDYVLIKNVDAVRRWPIFDSVRNDFGSYLDASDSLAEQTDSTIEISVTSTGFVLPAGANYTINSSGYDYIYMAFKINPSPQPAAGNMSFLVIAGGGGGSRYGGGGAGGLRTSYGNTSGGGSSSESDITLAAGTYTITVGAGGSGGNRAASSNGANSTVSTITSTGGGNGWSSYSPTVINGGSGGGGNTSNAGGTGTANQGFDGGPTGYGSGATYNGTGGGGASQAGQASGSSAGTAGNGGNGLTVSITGASVTYAGGGGGADYETSAGGTGGTGGGGNGTGWQNGATPETPNGTTGTTNLGGGGGGAMNGGSGVVILRLATSEYSGTTTGSPTVTTDGDYTILTYTGSGTYVHS